MSTLLLRLAGPLQSWGVSSKFSTRDTSREPSKSGVIGMLSAALGRRRDEPIDDLASLKFGVRIDQAGQILRDYHTAHHPTNSKLAFITERYYIADSVFLVGLEGDDDFLKELDEAMRSPAFPLYLGRRSCPPSGRISLGIRDKCLINALADEEWQASDWLARREPPKVDLDVVIDSDDDSGFLQRDVPISFSQKNRRHTVRRASFTPLGITVENPRSRDYSNARTEHDPFTQLQSEEE